MVVPINAKSTRKRKDLPVAGDATVGTKSAGRGVRPPHCPRQTRLPDASGRLPTLQEHATIDADEAYGEQEKALSEFLRLHPMLSL